MINFHLKTLQIKAYNCAQTILYQPKTSNEFLEFLIIVIKREPPPEFISGRYLCIVLYNVPAAGTLSVGIACRQPPSLPHAVQNVLLL